MTVFCAADDVAQVRAMLGAGPEIRVANEPPYRLAEQSTFLLRLLRANAHIVHFPHYNLPLAYPRRFAVTIHDLFSYQFPDIHSGRVARAVNRMLIANAVRRAAAIITPSTATADELLRIFSQSVGRISAIPEAAEPRFRPARNRAGEEAWQHYFGIRPPYFFYLGQWKSYKNLPLLIEAFSQLLARQPGQQLVIAGGDPRHPEVAAMARRLPSGSVVLPGHLPDDAVPDLYRGAVAVVVPSRAEGFGLPVLEAMACGVAVVCSEIPVLREIADGVAIFADPSSAGAFAAAMEAAIDPDRNADRIRRGLERAQQFSWQNAADRTIAVYERALSGRPSRRSETD